MKVLDIIPEKIHVTLSLETDELVMLEKAIAMCQFAYNGENLQDVAVKNFFVDEFSKIISGLVKELTEG